MSKLWASSAGRQLTVARRPQPLRAALPGSLASPTRHAVRAGSQVSTAHAANAYAKAGRKQSSPGAESKTAMEEMQAEMRRPGDIIPVSFQTWREAPEYRWGYLKQLVFYRFQNLAMRTATWWQAKPKWNKPSLLNLDMGWRKMKTIRELKKLHRDYGHAYASGNVGEINRICTKALARRVEALLSRRSRNRFIEWSVERYLRRLRYPRIVSDSLVTGLVKDGLSHQVVLAIDSEQLLMMRDRYGKLLPNGEKRTEQLEYWLFIRTIRKDTWEKTPWKIWGTVEPTTPEEARRTKEIMEGMAGKEGLSKVKDIVKKQQA